MTAKVIKSIILVGILAGSLTASAFAARNEDYFGRSTSSPAADSLPTTTATVPAPTPQNFIQKPPAVVFFEKYDDAVVLHSATDNEKLALTKDFGSPPQLERVIAWQKTASSVAKKYRDLASMLNSASLPQPMRMDPQAQDVLDYMHQMADWYTDSASWLEDYIKPRPPARTQEELDSALQKMHDRSETLKLTMTHLQEMDSKLRDHFHVHAPKSEDGLMKYVRKPLTK